MSKIVLLTGSTGFVGKEVLYELCQQNIKVKLIIRDQSKIPKTSLKNIYKVVITPDLFSETVDWWANICSDVDIVIHVAWYAEHGKYLFSEKNIDCLIGTLNLAKGASLAGVHKFVGIGTCAEYDSSYGDLSVDTSLKPDSPYAGAKTAVYNALSQWLPSQGVEFVWCRLFYIYGKGEHTDRFVPYIRSRLSLGRYVELTNGNQIRDYLNVEKVGKIIANVATDSTQGAINICSGVAITIREFAEKIADEYGRRDLLKFGARPSNLNEPKRIVGVK